LLRVCFLVDGFNLYHSLCDLERDIGNGQIQAPEGSLKWLNIDSLCASYMGAIDPAVRGRTVFYFSALAHHCEKRSPGVVARHERFITALQTTGVVPILGSFKEKDIHCSRFAHGIAHCAFSDEDCDGTFKRHEEKQTDVALACKLVELATTESECSTAVIVGGDTDLVPAIETARRLRPGMQVVVAFPYKRHSNQLRKAADRVITVRPDQYAKHQFPRVVETARGTQIEKPEAW